MVHTCTVQGCRSRSSDDIKRSFFRIPAVITREGEVTEGLSRERREKWLAEINRKNYRPSAYTKICSDHFVTGITILAVFMF